MRTVQLAEADPSKCIGLWREARRFRAVIRVGDPLDWVDEVWTSAGRETQDASICAPVLAELVHFTSGTTGRPSAVGRSWASLDAGVRVRAELLERRWACAYPVDSFAGIQVVLACEAHRAEPVAARRADELANAMEDCAAGSATAAMWRVAVRLTAGGSHVRQITIGGDAADAVLLAALRRRFPAARITQTYVTSEAGVVCSWSDEREGIPKAIFDRRASVALDGEVMVSRDELASDGTGLVRTGDLATIRTDRVFLIGRRAAVVNVGGVKVSPEEIEDLIRLHCSSTMDVRAYGEQDRILGSHVAVEYVAADAVQFHRELDAVPWPTRAHRPLRSTRVERVARDQQGKLRRCAY